MNTKPTPVLFPRKEECYGCTACYSICPQKAISMDCDDEGFAYPHVNQSLCISCGKCLQVCPRRIARSDFSPVSIYGIKHPDENVRKSSSSGGAFTCIAQWIESQGGTIYGVTYDEKFRAVHRSSDDMGGWHDFRKSKYMQSNLGNTFRDVYNDLKLGKWVLFSGTPCQVDGLQYFLRGTNTENLLTCDIVCHGTPSPKIWSDYLRFLEKNRRAKISSVDFRDKSKQGWHDSTLTIRDVYGNTLLEEKQNKNCFFLLFFNHLILRPSCHECKYANLSRPGDFTLGDYWGIEKHFPHFDDNKGVSLLMCNSLKATQVWDNIKSSVMSIQLDASQCLQPNLCAPASSSNRRNIFWEDYRKNGFVFAARKQGLLPQPKYIIYKHRIRILLSRIKQRIVKLFFPTR